MTRVTLYTNGSMEIPEMLLGESNSLRSFMASSRTLLEIAKRSRFSFFSPHTDTTSTQEVHQHGK